LYVCIGNAIKYEKLIVQQPKLLIFNYVYAIFINIVLKMNNMKPLYFSLQILVIVLFCNSVSFAQNTWNLVGQDNSTRSINVLSKIINNKIYVPSFSINWNDIPPYVQVSLTNYNFNGEIIFDSLYGNVNQTFALSPSSFGSTYNQGTFCFAGDLRYPINNSSKRGFLALDTLNVTKMQYISPFNFDSTVSFGGISHIKKIGDKYFIVSTFQHPDPYQWANDNWCSWNILELLDEAGNVVASRTIGGGINQQDYQYNCNSVHYFDNHYYAIVNKLNYRQWQTSPTDLVIYKLDTLLNVVSSYSTTNGNWYNSNSSVTFGNGDFVVGGIYVDARDNEYDFWQKKYLRKYDKNLNIIWTKYFGSRNQNTGISKLIITSDGHIAGTGTDGLLTDTIGMHITGCIFKFTENGDSVWMHNYQAMDSPIYGDVNVLLDIDEIIDGGFVACGYGDETNNGNLKRGWLIRVDDNGCLTSDCVSSAKEIENIKDFFVYPNPSNEILNITNSNQISFYHIFQFDGKLVEQGNTFPINVSEFSNGLYFLRINTKSNLVINQKIIKQ
jgi:hypothetical protein